MQPATIRRLLVFGVCLIAVGCLYLVPSKAMLAGGGAPSRTASPPGEQNGSTGGPTRTALVSATSPHASPDASLATSRDRSADASPTVGARAGATAVEPGRDDSPPAAVGPVTVISSNAERLTIDWPESDDDVGVVSYSVWLNGFLVLATQDTRATLAWFNDSDIHVIQVRAVDAAGNEGPASPTLLAKRPIPTEPATTQPTTSTPAAGRPTPTTKPGTSPSPDEEADAMPDTDHAAATPARNEESGAEEDGS